jgi:hypothetical protein
MKPLSLSGHVGFVVDKMARGQVSPSISVSAINSLSTDYSKLIINRHPGLVQ